MDFGEFKLNSDGLIPVIVQDYKTNEVLMMAYMNEEAFEHTVKTGRMTYYSRKPENASGSKVRHPGISSM